MKNRGQAAMEFIMTYGWAILVVLTAISALAYFGVLSPSKYLPEKCVFTTGIGCNDFIFIRDATNGLDVNFTITNGLGESVTLANAVVTAPNGSSVACTIGTAALSADASSRIICQNLLTSGVSVGQNLKVSAAINYSFSDSPYVKTAVGDMSGKVQ